MKEPIQTEIIPDGRDVETPECKGALKQDSERMNSNGENNEELSTGCIVSQTKEDAVRGEERRGTSSSETGHPDESKTSDYNIRNEALGPRAENVIETSNNIKLVNNSNHSLEDLTTSTLESPRHNSNVHNISDQPKCSEEKTGICDGQKDGDTEDVDVTLSEESPNLNATVDNSSQSSAQTISHTNQCKTSVNNVRVENPNNKGLEQVNASSSMDNILSQDMNIQVVSNVCKAIVRSISQGIVDSMIEKVVNNTEDLIEKPQETEHQSIKNKTNEVKETKLELSVESKGIAVKINQSEETLEQADSKEHQKASLETKEILENHMGREETVESKEECFSQRSDDYDETEKSDGSDSGIGSELIDEAMTKSSSDSSSSTSTTGESWVTPCISFAEMSDIDFNAGPRLSMPTFDDLTMTCDVFAMEKKQIGVVETQEKHAVEAQDDHQHSDSSQPTSVAPDSESKSGTIDSDEDIDISSIDDDQTNKCESSSFTPAEEPESYVPATLLRELSSIPSTSRQTFKSNLKRTRLGAVGCSESVPANKRFKSQGIRFDSVSVYYFPRTQGFTCVPSQGGSTLGMSWHHSHVQTFTLSQYGLEQRRVHQRMARSPFCSQGSADSMSGADSNDDSDSDEPLSDAEFDSDSSYTLQPVKIRQRRAMLRAAGIDKIDPAEKNECKQIRISREFCGCTCDGYCDPEICACALAGIKCQVDRQSFPCGCSRDCCANPKGRIEFNPVRVHSHYIQTMLRMKAQKKDDDDMPRMYDYQQFHNYHPAAEFEPTSLSSYYPHHHPQYLASHHHHHVHNELLSNFELQHQMHACYEPFNNELSLYNNMASSQEKMNESFSELIPTSYSGEAFNNNTPTGEMYSASINSGYPYNTTASGYQREDLSNNGTEQYSRIHPGAGTIVGNELRSGYETSVAYDQYSQVSQQSTCVQNYPLGPGGVKLVAPGSVHFNPTDLNVNPAMASVCTQPQVDEETANFGEIISKTMVEEVIV